MSSDQIMGLVRQILPVLGGILTALGWLTPDQVSTFTSVVMQIAGPISIVIGVVWSLFADSKTSITASMAQMGETDVKQSAAGKVTITVNDPDLAKTALANATPPIDPHVP